MTNGFNPERRRFLKKAAGFTIATIAGLEVLGRGIEFYNTFNHYFGFDISERIKQIKHKEAREITEEGVVFLQDKYGIKLSLPNTIKILKDGVSGASYEITGEVLDYVLHEAVSNIVRLVAFYPPKNLRRFCDEIIIAGNVSSNSGGVIGGVAFMNFKKIVVAVQPKTGENYSFLGYMVRTLNHELGHRFITVGSKLESAFFERFYPGRNREDVYDKKLSSDDPLPEGFATRHGVTKLWEDVASCVEVLFLAHIPNLKFPEIRDPLLQAKVAWLKGEIINLLELPATYFEDLKKGLVNYGYWVKHGLV